MPSEAAMPIGRFSELSRIPVSTLRYYDEIDLLKPATVDPFSQYRYYDEPQLYEANFIETWKSLGFNLTEIKCLMSRGTGDLAESCYRKQIAVMEEEIRRREQRKEMLNRNLRTLNRFSLMTEADYQAVTRRIISEEYLLTLEDTRPCTSATLVEMRNALERLIGKHKCLPDPDSPFLTTRFLENREEEGNPVLYQWPQMDSGSGTVRQLVKVPVHAALCGWHRGNLSDVESSVTRILDFAEKERMNIGKSLSYVYWIDPSITLDEALQVTEIRIPLKKQKPLDSQVT